MTTFTTITNALVAVGAKPFASTVQALRDNPLAIAEQDPTTPLTARLGHWLLGTINTTSGSSQSLTSLDLTPYKFLLCVTSGVSISATTSLRIAGQQCSGNATSFIGQVTIDLIQGQFWSQLAPAGAVADGYVGLTGYSTATTTVTFSLSGATFTAGTIRVYGVK